MMEAHVDIAGQELIVEYDFRITAKGCPASGPTHDSGGEPAGACEFEIEVHGIRKHTLQGEVEIEMPQWLKDVLTTHLHDRDDIYDIVDKADRDPWHGRDPDYERDVQNENRELDWGPRGDEDE